MKNEEIQGFCGLPIMKPRVFSSDVLFERESLILVSDTKWANGTQLKYYFLEGSNNEKDVVRKAFDIWKNIGIGLRFKEVTNKLDAEIRISFKKGAGSWSYLGKQILNISSNEPTMNFGWDITTDIDTALHEIGHTLGLTHEQFNNKAGIVWDEEAVYRRFSGYPNYWDKETIDFNILRKVPPNEVVSSEWDPNSIMQYKFGPGLILKPEEFKDGINPEPGLSEKDKLWIQKFYPPLSFNDLTHLKVTQSVELILNNAEQASFIFIPEHSRKYTIQTFGSMDCLLVLFNLLDDDDQVFLSGDDDSGVDRSAIINYKLIKDHRYLITVRKYYSYNENNSLMIY